MRPTRPAAHLLLGLDIAAAIALREEKLEEAPVDRTVTFADAAERWLTHLEHIDGAKPTTLADYRYLLAPADVVARKRGHQPAARIMRTFGHRPIAEITTSDIARFLARLDKEPAMGPRASNEHRQVMASVFEHAMREPSFGVHANPVCGTDKRREPDDKPIELYEPAEVMALARAAANGLHRDPRRPAVSDEEPAERARADEQDAALYVVAAFTGLRLGELLALSWRDVNVPDAKLLVEASWSAGQLSSAQLTEVAQDPRRPARRSAGRRPGPARRARPLHRP